VRVPVHGAAAVALRETTTTNGNYTPTSSGSARPKFKGKNEKNLQSHTGACVCAPSVNVCVWVCAGR
jgi:hypothetical protein